MSKISVAKFIEKIKNKLDVMQNMAKAMHPRKFFGMDREDMFVSRYFPETVGKYVDIGSGNPIIFSNTFYFYRLGWKGITVDPLYQNNILHRVIRHRDTQIRALVGLGKNNESYKFYEFIPSELSSANMNYAKSVIESGAGKLVKISNIKSIKLSDISGMTNPFDPCFLSIDVEAQDLEVLMSNNFSQFNPRVIIIEDMEYNIKFNQSKIKELLNQENYTLKHWLGTSSIYVSNDYLNLKTSVN
jgi:hypothetical protein